jgi:hypothetical protein
MRARAARFHRGSPAVSHTKHVASYRPRSLGTETVDIFEEQWHGQRGHDKFIGRGR